jgi:hypothetical protein
VHVKVLCHTCRLFDVAMYDVVCFFITVRQGVWLSSLWHTLAHSITLASNFEIFSVAAELSVHTYFLTSRVLKCRWRRTRRRARSCSCRT